MNREYHKWWSPRLGRVMELLVLGHAGMRVLVFPTRGGRFYEYEELRIAECLRHRIEVGQLQLYCVDSIDAESFYCWWAHPSGRIRRHQQYEEYILNEVFPLMNQKNPYGATASHGCSLGAYHAANICFRHPHLFNKLVALSGRYDLTMAVEAFTNLFDGYYSDEVYFHTPTHFLPNLHCDVQLGHLRRLDITIVIGEEDPFRGNNEHLSGILRGKGVRHNFHLWNERAHRAYYWRRMVPLYL